MKKNILRMILFVNIFGCMQSIIAMQSRTVLDKIQRSLRDLEAHKQKKNDPALYQSYKNLLLFYDEKDEAKQYIDPVDIANEALIFARNTDHRSQKEWIKYFEELLKKYSNLRSEEERLAREYREHYETEMLKKANEEERLAREWEIKGEKNKASGMYDSAKQTLENLLDFYEEEDEDDDDNIFRKILNISLRIQQIDEKKLYLLSLLKQEEEEKNIAKAKKAREAINNDPAIRAEKEKIEQAIKFAKTLNF